jgi:elongation factor Ts
VLVELNCETDFVARTSEFADLAHEIALQVAAMQPLYVSEDDLLEDSPDRDDLTPDRRAALFLAEQPYIRDPSKTIGQLVTEVSARTGENIQVRRFMRYELSQVTDQSEQAE